MSLGPPKSVFLYLHHNFKLIGKGGGYTKLTIEQEENGFTANITIEGTWAFIFSIDEKNGNYLFEGGHPPIDTLAIGRETTFNVLEQATYALNFLLDEISRKSSFSEKKLLEFFNSIYESRYCKDAPSQAGAKEVEN